MHKWGNMKNREENGNTELSLTHLWVCIVVAHLAAWPCLCSSSIPSYRSDLVGSSAQYLALNACIVILTSPEASVPKVDPKSLGELMVMFWAKRRL